MRLAGAHDAAAAGRLLHAFQQEYDEPSPGPQAYAERLAGLVERGDTVVVLGGTRPDGIAVLRLRPSLHSLADEAYLAELYVAPDRRGQGLGEALLAHAVQVARDRGCDHLDVVTSTDDVAALGLYAKLGLRRTEGDGGPELVALELDL